MKYEIGKTYPDPHVKGLQIRVFPNRKSYYLYYRTDDGRERRPKIGDVGTITLSQARKKARQWLAEVILGGDPSLERKGLRSEPTLQECFDLAILDYFSAKNFKRSGYNKTVERYYRTKIKSKFGSKKLTQITASQVKAWHESFGEHQVEANRALAVLSKLFSFAEAKGLLKRGLNPCTGVKRFKEKSRMRYATANEVRSILKILKRDYPTNKRKVLFILTLLTTGARPKSIERATWDELKEVEENGVKFGVLSFEGKSGPEQVIIPPGTYSKLCYFMRQPGKKIFGIKSPRRYWDQIRKELGCEDLWMRDLRRTFATIGLSTGNSIDVIGELLNHKTTNTTKIYAKLLDDVRTKTTFQIESAIKSLSEE